ncbi:MAG: type II toxin-antitoxin system VapC family toxin [Bacteroidales bacterium]|nr:type II toxin-antitoxin system VapC family toxin [Bacteroidales bacterium]
MTYYFDTSALVKLFSNEAGSNKVKEIIDNPSNDIWVLELALVELMCAVFRKYRNHEINEQNLQRIEAAIENQFDLFNIVPMAGDLMNETLTLIKRFGKENGLRTLDALHIAGWLAVAGYDWQFVSSDRNQISVVIGLNYETLEI